MFNKLKGQRPNVAVVKQTRSSGEVKYLKSGLPGGIVRYENAA